MKSNEIIYRIRKKIGEEAWYKLIEEAGGLTIYIPINPANRVNIDLRTRNEEIRDAIDAYMLRFPTESMSNALLALGKEFKLGYSRMYQIYKLGY